MSDGELKEHALNSSHDFYELLGVASTVNDSEIRRAYRKTALKYHPDKVGATQTNLDRFHLLQIAYDVLLDSGVRQLYDNARRAREEKKERDAAYAGRRRELKDELERRESAGAAGFKRKREDAQEEEAFQSEVRRLAADGARRRREREEQLKRAAREDEEFDQDEPSGHTGSESGVAQAKPQGVQESDRTIKFRYLAASLLTEDELKSRFERFGKIQYMVVKDKKIKPEGEKHRRDYMTALMVYESIVGAYAAINDIPRLAIKDPSWTVFQGLDWASGKEPTCLQQWNGPHTPTATRHSSSSPLKDTAPAGTPRTPMDKVKANHLRSVPSFGSFKGTPKVSGGILGSNVAVGSPTVEELTMIRLKNAERKRLAESLKREEAEEEAAAMQEV